MEHFNKFNLHWCLIKHFFTILREFGSMISVFLESWQKSCVWCRLKAHKHQSWWKRVTSGGNYIFRIFTFLVTQVWGYYNRDTYLPD